MHDDGEVLYASTLLDDFLVASDDGYDQDYIWIWVHPFMLLCIESGSNPMMLVG